MRPFDTRMFNVVEILNEICLLVGSYLMVEFTEYEINPKFRYSVGWAMTGVMLFTATANISLILFKAFSVLFSRIKDIFLKLRMKKISKN